MQAHLHVSSVFPTACIATLVFGDSHSHWETIFISYFYTPVTTLPGRKEDSSWLMVSEGLVSPWWGRHNAVAQVMVVMTYGRSCLQHGRPGNKENDRSHSQILTFNEPPIVT